MTIAQSIKASVSGAVAVTLAGGYAVFSDRPRSLFEPCHVIRELRDDSGRVTLLEASYSDGSKLTFRWSPARGPSYAVV